MFFLPEEAGALLADVAQSAEHSPCKRAVMSSILIVGSVSQFVGWPNRSAIGQATSGLNRTLDKFSWAVTQVANGG